MSDFDLKVREQDGVIVLNTNGYLNNFGGEQIASVCLQKISEGKRKFLVNLEKTEMVNSIGVSILIEVIEELQSVNGKIAYCNLVPIVEKTFNIMGISKYAKIHSNEEEALFKLRKDIENEEKLKSKLNQLTNLESKIEDKDRRIRNRS